MNIKRLHTFMKVAMLFLLVNIVKLCIVENYFNTINVCSPLNTVKAFCKQHVCALHSLKTMP